MPNQRYPNGSEFVVHLTCLPHICFVFAKYLFNPSFIVPVFHSHRDSEVRVTRGCGWVRHHRECYKADNADHLETVCQCFEDHCNGSGRVNVALAVAALCAFGRLLLS